MIELSIEDLGRQTHRLLRGDGPVCPDFNREFVIVGYLFYPGVLHRIVDLQHRGVDTVNRDGSDRSFLKLGMLVAVGGHIALPFAQRNLHRELGARIQRGDVHTRVEYLNLRIAFDASGGHFTLALGLYSHRLGFIAIQLCGKPLDVEDNLSYVFFHSRDCR